MNPHDSAHEVNEAKVNRNQISASEKEKALNRVKRWTAKTAIQTHTDTTIMWVIKNFCFCRFYDVNDCVQSIPELLQHNIIAMCTDCDLLKFE